MAGIKYESVDQYISAFPENTRELLNQIRKTIRENAAGAEELISYNIPAFRYQGMLLFYSAYQNHVSISTAPFTIFEVFKTQLQPYKQSKSTIQFPLNKPLPLTLIEEITRFRMKENEEIAAARAVKKKAKTA